MDTIGFLKRILPTTGIYCIDTPATKGFKHIPCDSIEHAAAVAADLDSRGLTVYHACSSFAQRWLTVTRDGADRKVFRVQDNVAAVKALWLDLDVGASEEGKRAKYPTQSAAIQALAKFLQDTALPMPMVVSSGYGIHCYWPFTADVVSHQWRAGAALLKQLCETHKFLADPTRTADSASVLRPVGTHNRKDADNPRTVTLVRDSADTEFGVLYAILEAAAKKAGVLLSSRAPVEVFDAAEYPPSSAHRIADRCQQIRVIRDTRGNVTEPIWYAGVQLLYHTVEGEPLIHEWSKGHPQYSAEATDKKISQIRSMGPTRCETFASHNSEGCVGCPLRGTITSPIQIGVEIKPAAAPVIPETELTVPNPPVPFLRAEDGIYEMVEDAPVRIYEYDLFVTQICYDEGVGHEQAIIRHWLPNDGWLEFSLRTALIERRVDLAMALRDHHVHPLNSAKMARYIDAYIREIRRQTPIHKVYTAMGWKDNQTKFVLGQKVFSQDGTISRAGITRRYADKLGAFSQQGGLEAWTQATAALAGDEYAAHAFTLLTGFGAPLMKLTGYGAAFINMQGTSGVGKTTMGRFALSIYGDPERLTTSAHDTKNAKLEKIGMYSSLPVFVDEVTNITAADLSDFIYTISSGRGKERLRRDGSPMPVNEWSTLVLGTSNSTLADKLQLAKGNTEAENLRLFEYTVPTVEGAAVRWVNINAMLARNYGVAGEVYIKYIVANSPEIAREIETTLKKVNDVVGTHGKERFWSAVVATAITGGIIARKLGLIQFDLAPIWKWLVSAVKDMRLTVASNHNDAVTLLSSYLDETVGNRLIVGSAGENNARSIHSLFQRLEATSGRLYINRAHLRDYLTERQESFRRIRDDLISSGVLVNEHARKVLGAGTPLGGVQMHCWQLDLNHPALSGAVPMEVAA